MSVSLINLFVCLAVEDMQFDLSNEGSNICLTFTKSSGPYVSLMPTRVVYVFIPLCLKFIETYCKILAVIGALLPGLGFVTVFASPSDYFWRR